jgi:predicted phosphodiesterase
VLALLYDVHGNVSALEAVVADARAQGADRWVMGGDYTLFGPEPEETLAQLRSLSPAIWLRGNGERWTADPGAAPDNAVVPPAIAACRDALGEPDVAALGELPEQGVHEQTRYVHASPVSDVRSFLPQPEADEQELLAGIEEPRLVFGHTHLPFERSGPHGVLLLNPGSVGMPFDGDARAAYALVHDDGAVESRRAAYDHTASAAAVRQVLGEAGELPARRIEQARFDAG